jgi:hypothetical protein
MADFSQEKKYNYNWESSKFKGVLFEGNKISNLVNDVGYLTSVGSISSASFSSTASYVNPLRQNAYLTGSLNVTGSTLFIGTHTLSGSNTITGNTVLSGSFEVSGSSNFHNSIFIVTGSTSIKGITSISGSTGITGSLSVIGDINVVSGSGFYRWGNKLFNYAQFAETASLPITANVSGSFLLPTTYFNEGIYITSGSRITFQNTGLYNIQFSAVVDQGSGKPQLSIWFKKNGLNIDNSNTIASLQANSTALLAWNFAYPFNTGEYVEMWYHTTTTNTTLAYHAAANGFPAAPSLIVTVTQIA